MLSLPYKDICLAVSIALCWAFNLVVIKLTIQGISPLTFGFLRFLFVAFPLVFFIKRPNISIGKLILIGLVLGVAKFALLFKGIELGVSIGMCALTLQTQVIFTAIFSYFIYGYHLSKREICGMFVALCGITLLGLQSENSSSFSGFIFVLASALCWGISNNLSKTLKDVNVLELTVWMSLVPPIPYFLLSQAWEGTDTFYHSLQMFGLKELAATAYIVIVATLFGLAAWTWLMSRYNPAKVSVYGLLIPVFSVFFGWLCFGESLDFKATIACLIVFLGLIINQWPKKSLVNNKITMACESLV